MDTCKSSNESAQYFADPLFQNLKKAYLEILKHLGQFFADNFLNT